VLKLKKLTLGGIATFVERQTVYFDRLGHLIQFDGENRNTGGSSGAAKSSVFNALDYLLGVNDLPTTVLQSRYTKEKIFVEGEFDWDGKHVVITRAAKLAIDVDGDITTGSSDLTEEKLDQILGMPRKVFRKLLHKRQKEGGFFLEFTPKETYTFLTDAMNLSAERKKLEKVEAKIAELEKSKASKESAVLSLKASVKATQESILALGLAPVRDIHQSVILELKGKMDASASALAKVLEDHKGTNDLLDSQRPILIPNPALETAEQLPQPELMEANLGNSAQISELEDQIAVLTKEISELKQAESDRIKKVTAAIQERKLTLSVLSHKCTIASTAKNEAIKLAGEIKKIRDAICPTCEQSWVTETAKIKETELLDRLTQFKVQIQDGVSAENTIKTTQNEIESLQIELNPQGLDEILHRNSTLIGYNSQLSVEKDKANTYKAEISVKNAEILKNHAEKQKAINYEVSNRNAGILADISAKNKAASDEYQFKVTAVRETQARELEQARGQADVDRRAFEAAANKLKAFTDSLARYESSLKTMKEQEANYLDLLLKAEEDFNQLLKQISLAEELRKAVKLFISISFDGALESIGDAATKIIRCVPTMSNATIQFEGQKETKDGKIKEEVNAVISMNGDIGIPIKSLSGGERSSVDLAVDLAVIEFIEEESAKGIDVFILDEPFTGLDPVGIEMVLEFLRNLTSTKKLIIVDHNSEVKEMVSDRLVVVREGNSSTIANQEN
jgi:DNA repair exonuclease SbcCD ATPase subunit